MSKSKVDEFNSEIAPLLAELSCKAIQLDSHRGFVLSTLLITIMKCMDGIGMDEDDIACGMMIFIKMINDNILPKIYNRNTHKINHFLKFFQVEIGELMSSNEETGHQEIIVIGTKEGECYSVSSTAERFGKFKCKEAMKKVSDMDKERSNLIIEIASRREL